MVWRPRGKPPYNKNTRRRLALIERDGENCWLCGQPFSMKRPPSLDHVIPKSKGGSNAMDNLKLAHAKCNNKRGNGEPIPASQLAEPATTAVATGGARQIITHGDAA